MGKNSGGFTLPGEAGYEAYTLKLAKKWGADVIRDSDGTKLSDEILNAGYSIYSTVCVIREHNEWLSNNHDCYQQTFLVSEPVLAAGDTVELEPLSRYYDEQFVVNDSAASLKYWEVYDRTDGERVADEDWEYDAASGKVTVLKTSPFHYYTVNFLAYRIWEEISMYNHVTNNWDKEHLAPLDPRTDKAKEYLRNWMVKWCEEHPHTNVVRFTSLFYNFVWIWGNDEANRNIFSDWGSYDFTVSEKALEDFEKEYGYAMTSEDFINAGKFNVTHMPAGKKMLDYMDFTQRFVADFGKELVDIVHEYGKQAYVFYDDSWVGLEPYGKYFGKIGFDGLIKCVFSGYEARLCAGVDVPVHELRLHPYLFPVGLGGAPTFSEGGDPAADARKYWVDVRRALLRARIDRLGLGGYLHLTEGFQDFNDYIEELLGEFRTLRELHVKDSVYTIPVKIAVLHSWGRLRSWSLSGHFHETYMHTLIHINETLAGLPFDVDFINFDDVLNGKAEDYDLIINAGRAGDAWSGGAAWKNPEIVARLQQWVNEGGVYIGAGESSAADGGELYLKMGHVMGVDIDTGARVCHGRIPVVIDTELKEQIIRENVSIRKHENVYLLDVKASVLLAEDGIPKLVVNRFGEGFGVYMSDYSKTYENMRMLVNIILYCSKKNTNESYITDNIFVDCAYFKRSCKLVAVNNSCEAQETTVNVFDVKRKIALKPYEMQVIDL